MTVGECCVIGCKNKATHVMMEKGDPHEFELCKKCLDKATDVEWVKRM